jgi:hypothetical protein
MGVVRLNGSIGTIDFLDARIAGIDFRFSRRGPFWIDMKLTSIPEFNRSMGLSALLALSLTSCVTTSLSNPSGSGHDRDLSVYDLTGVSANPTEAEIRRAAAASGALPMRGAKFLLVQSGAVQPDQELMDAYQAYGHAVPWTGLAEERSSDDAATSPRGALARKLRLAAAQQQCSHVIVVFGEIQKDGEAIPVINWVPIASDVLPNRYSGMRFYAQAAVLETRSSRFRMVSAQPKETRGVEINLGGIGSATNRSLRLKGKAYPELAAASFRG